jgi:hypothetical protein
MVVEKEEKNKINIIVVKVFFSLIYNMTHGAAQHNGRHMGTTAAPPFDSDSPPRLLSLYP